jgi:hypothetical protein
LRRDAQDVAEQRRVEIASEAPVAADQRHAKREASRRDDPDGGVGANLLAPRKAVDHQGSSEAPEASPGVEVDAQHVAGNRPAEHGMREPMPDVAHPPQHDVHADQPAQPAHQRRREQAPREEVVAERLQQDHAPASSASPR